MWIVSIWERRVHSIFCVLSLWAYLQYITITEGEPFKNLSTWLGIHDSDQWTIWSVTRSSKIKKLKVYERGLVADVEWDEIGGHESESPIVPFVLCCPL